MTERLPENLSTLYSAFSREAIENLFEGETYVYDGVEFVCQYSPESTPSRFFIVKPKPFVEYFVSFCEQFRGGSIFELGIARGDRRDLVIDDASRDLDLTYCSFETLAHGVTVRRGAAEVVDAFSLSALYRDRFGFLPPVLEPDS